MYTIQQVYIPTMYTIHCIVYSRYTYIICNLYSRYTCILCTLFSWYTYTIHIHLVYTEQHYTWHFNKLHFPTFTTLSHFHFSTHFTFWHFFTSPLFQTFTFHTFTFLPFHFFYTFTFFIQRFAPGDGDLLPAPKHCLPSLGSTSGSHTRAAGSSTIYTFILYLCFYLTLWLV